MAEGALQTLWKVYFAPLCRPQALWLFEVCWSLDFFVSLSAFGLCDFGRYELEPLIRASKVSDCGLSRYLPRRQHLLHEAVTQRRAALEPDIKNEVMESCSQVTLRSKIHICTGTNFDLPHKEYAVGYFVAIDYYGALGSAA
ncbi:hypothetical protein [Roseibium sp. M-1]